MSAEGWAPLSVHEITELFSRAPFRWWISGGHALDLHVGTRWRAHEDADVGIRRDQAELVHSWLESWDCHIAADGRLSPWKGEPLRADRHQNNVWLRRSAVNEWAIDLVIGEGDGDRWIYRRDPSVSRPWTEAVLSTKTGIPYLAPDLQLLFKSMGPRPKDHLDAERVIPTLDAHSRAFVASHIGIRHPWQRLLAGHQERSPSSSRR